MQDYDVGATIARHRIAKDLTQGQAAALAGVSVRTFTNLEGNARQPSDDVTPKVIEALIPADSPDRRDVARALLARAFPLLYALAQVGG